MTIPVFVASSNRFADCEWLTEFSIRENTAAEVNVHIVRPHWYGMEEAGCTGFTNVRYAVPQLCRLFGYEYGIYLDVDMLVVGDIAELWGYRKYGKWVCLQDGSTEVSVVCSSLQFPDKSVLHTRRKGSMAGGEVKSIPLTWNCEDAVCDGMKLLHFTDLKAQPWFYDHPNTEVVAIYKEYRERHHSRDGA